jgi:hypothetical protein
VVSDQLAGINKWEGWVTALTSVIKMIAVLLAASFLGNWFLAEIKKSRALKLPWYTPYLSTPGLLIIVAIFIPVVLWISNY